MKTYKKFFGIIVCLLFGSALQTFAQDTPWIIEVTTLHWNMEKEDFSMPEWKAIESEYHQKVTMKNELVKGAETLLHTYSPDNSELIFIRAYENWGDVYKSADRDWELTKEAWPDSADRVQRGMNAASYYSNLHSDEIYSTLSHAKFKTDWNDSTSVVFYMKKTHSVPPSAVKDGSGKERNAVFKEYIENVYHKDDDIQAYYPMRHLYGADGREVVEFFVYESLEKMVGDVSSNNSDLVKAHWPDEDKRKAFFKKFIKYNSPWHGDWVYTNVPELHK
ncbi:MAG: hypothetical protein ACI9IP_003046 [Arcticibacterium sp.]|jgi:hypothetical protein